VTLWTSGAGVGHGDQAGLPVSSVLVAAGEPGHVVALLDPDSDLFARVQATRTAVVQLLEWQHRHLADAFAGQAPAPGGAFRLAQWTPSRWGPVLDDASAWIGVRLVEGEPPAAGWSLLVDTVIENVEIRDERAPLVYRRGRYSRVTSEHGSASGPQT
jgi:flavin reductase (DIM6/NTAB) family NADH-FMN oxidoreductase RutF